MTLMQEIKNLINKLNGYSLSSEIVITRVSASENIKFYPKILKNIITIHSEDSFNE